MRDSLDPKPLVADHIGPLEIVIHATENAQGVVKVNGTFRFQVFDQEGAVIDERGGPLFSKLPQGQADQVTNWASTLHARAKTAAGL